MICRRCNEEITPDDLPDPDGLAMHYECSLRSVVGSVAHQRRQCSCYGGKGEDDPELSIRENARRACNEWLGTQPWGRNE